MTDMEIVPLARNDIAAAKDVIAATDLFPPELLPEMALPALSGESPALWLVARAQGRLAGLAYTVPEELADGT